MFAAIVDFAHDPPKNAVLLAVGGGLFGSSTLLDERRALRDRPLAPAETSQLALLALALPIGIGMTTGRTPAPNEETDYAALLIAVGVVLSSVAFSWEDGVQHGMPALLENAALPLALAFGPHLALDAAARSAGDHDHGPRSCLLHDTAPRRLGRRRRCPTTF